MASLASLAPLEVSFTSEGSLSRLDYPSRMNLGSLQQREVASVSELCGKEGPMVQIIHFPWWKPGGSNQCVTKKLEKPLSCKGSTQAWLYDKCTSRGANLESVSSVEDALEASWC